jgi:hypothetical protein
LRPFDDLLKDRLGLNCNELFTGLTALGLVIERHTQCGHMQLGKWTGQDAILLELPATRPYLTNAVSHLASLLLRGTLRVSVEAFRKAIQSELAGLG